MAIAAGSAPRGQATVLLETHLNSPSSQTLSDISVTLSGSWDSGDIGGVVLYAAPSEADWNNQTGNVVTLGTKNQISNSAPQTFGFAPLGKISYAAGDWYFYLTAFPPSSGPDVGHTIIASKLTFTGLTGTVTDNQAAANGTKTIS